MYREKKIKRLRRARRRRRVRGKVYGHPERPRLSVFRSNKHIYAQIINDDAGHTLAAASSLEKEIQEKAQGLRPVEVGRLVGQVLAERARAAGVERVIFDRGFYKYHGRIKALADGAREGGLQF